jgi:integrase
VAQRGSGQRGQVTVADVRKVLVEAYRTKTRVLVRDGTVGGLFLLGGSRGAKWWLEFKLRARKADGGRPGSKYLCLGSVDVISPDDARREAALAKHRIMLGEDPSEERRLAQARATAPGWTDVRDEYLRGLQRRLRASSFDREVASLKRAFAALDPQQPLNSIGTREIALLVDQLPAGGAVAHHCVGAVGRLLDWAKSRSIIDPATINPVRLLSRGARPKRPPPRQRVLNTQELAELWRAAGELAPNERCLLRFLIATPLRRGEAGALEWSQVNRDAGVLILPGKVMKNGEPHTLPLGAMAQAVLDDLVSTNIVEELLRGPVDWPAQGRVFRPGIAWSWFKKRIDAVAKVAVADWTFHDFRRSFVSLLAERRHAEPVLDAMLAHRMSATRRGVLAVYQQSQRLPEQRKAMEAWDRILIAALDVDGAVLPFKRAC